MTNTAPRIWCGYLTDGGQMRKFLGNKQYDTEKAHLIAQTKTDALYRKKTGEYFLYSCPAKGAESIYPITADSAKDWASQHMKIAEFQKEFGDVEVEDARKKIFTFSLRVDTAEKLRRMAQAEGISASALVEKLVNQKC